MPRYYFRVHVANAVVLDPVRLELTSLEDAIADAHQARDEIMEEDALDQLWFEVMNHSGDVVATVPMVR